MLSESVAPMDPELRSVRVSGRRGLLDRGRARLRPTAASSALQVLEPAAADEISGFILEQRVSDGGFRGLSGASDLYYTFFALESLAALSLPLPGGRLAQHLMAFAEGEAVESLDAVHLVCLARCLARVGAAGSRPFPDGSALRASVEEPLGRVVDRIDSLRNPDGSVAMRPGGPGSIYAAFLATSLLGGTGLVSLSERRLVEWTSERRAPDGAFVDPGGSDCPTATVTSAACMVLGSAGEKVGADSLCWLESLRCPGGGFRASARAGSADLLSTAAALVALASLGAPLTASAAVDMSFVERCWCDSGGFCACPELVEAAVMPGRGEDCEYTFHALVCLGVLAEALSSDPDNRSDLSRPAGGLS